MNGILTGVQQRNLEASCKLYFLHRLVDINLVIFSIKVNILGIRCLSLFSTITGSVSGENLF